MEQLTKCMIKETGKLGVESVIGLVATFALLGVVIGVIAVVALVAEMLFGEIGLFAIEVLVVAVGIGFLALVVKAYVKMVCVARYYAKHH